MKPGKRFGLSGEQKSDVWRRWKEGQTLRVIATTLLFKKVLLSALGPMSPDLKS
jgi:hypothetical protein